MDARGHRSNRRPAPYTPLLQVCWDTEQDLAEGTGVIQSATKQAFLVKTLRVVMSTVSQSLKQVVSFVWEQSREGKGDLV